MLMSDVVTRLNPYEELAVPQDGVLPLQGPIGESVDWVVPWLHMIDERTSSEVKGLQRLSSSGMGICRSLMQGGYGVKETMDGSRLIDLWASCQDHSSAAPRLPLLPRVNAP